MVLDTKLDFSLHLKNVQNKVNRTIGLLCILQDTLPRTLLTTVFRSFIRPHPDYGDIIYDQAFSTPSKYRINSIQYCISNYRRNKRNFPRKTLSRVGL